MKNFGNCNPWLISSQNKSYLCSTRVPSVLKMGKIDVEFQKIKVDFFKNFNRKFTNINPRIVY